MPNPVSVELVTSLRSGHALGLPANLLSDWNLSAGASVPVRAGRRTVRATLYPVSDDTEKHVQISQALLRRLILPAGLRIHLKRRDDGTLEFGPFFGILARRVPASPPYGEQNRDFRVHMALGKQRHVAVYVFGPSDLNLRQGAIRARMYDEKRKRWVRRLMPIPHVVWNRSYWPGTRNRALLRRTLHALRGVGCVPFNPGVGTKWQVYQLLRADPNLRRHVPKTVRYEGTRTVLQMLRQSPGVYMKPLWGGWGIGIMRIRALGGRRYRVSRTIGRAGRNWNRIVGRTGLQTAVRRLVDGPYLVQQEIALARIGGRVSDVRVLAQRRANGEWGITGAVIRVGKPRSVISNLHGGGRAVEIRRGLSLMFPSQPELVQNILSDIHDLALRVIEKVEARFGQFGEIGIDLGVDTSGHVWFIEVNSRPGRNSFRITSPDDLWLASSANPVEYAKRLANFAEHPHPGR